MIVFSEIAESLCDQGLRVDLKQRSACLTQKLTPFSVGEPSLPFRNLTDDSYRRSPQLRCESVEFFSRKALRHFIHLYR